MCNSPSWQNCYISRYATVAELLFSFQFDSSQCNYQAMGQTAEELWFDSPQQQQIFLFKRPRPALDTICPVWRVLKALSPTQWQAQEANHSPPFSSGFKSQWYCNNKEFSVLYLQSNTTIFHLVVQQKYNYMFRPYMWAIFRLCFDSQSSYTRCMGCSLRVLGVTRSRCFYIGYHDQGLLQVDCRQLSMYTCHSGFLFLCYGYVTISSINTIYLKTIML